jgi:hypothetical protein
MAHRGVGGALTGGVLSTRQGQKFARKILDRRAEQLARMDANEDTGIPDAPAETPSLTEIEGKMVDLDLRISAILDYLQSGAEVGKAVEGLNLWFVDFLKTLPFYTRNDISKLNLIGSQLLLSSRGIDSIAESEPENIGLERQAVVVDQRTRQIAQVIKEYLKIIDRQLPERIMGLKSIVRKIIGVKMSEIYEPVLRAVEEAQPEEGFEGDDADAGVADEEEEEEDEDAEPNIPRSQAEIEAEVQRRLLNGEAPNADSAVRQLAGELAQFTNNYRPAATTNYSSIKRTLAQRLRVR